MKTELAGHLSALICVTIWGTSFIVSKNIMAVISPIQLMWLRFVIAYAVLWLLCPKWRFNIKEELWFLALSLFANTLYFLAENTALTLTQASNVSILVTTAPIFTAILFKLTGRQEGLSRKQTLGYAVAFIGVVMVVFNGVLKLKLNPLGDLLALGAAFSWAMYGIVLKRHAEDFDSFFLSRKLMFYALLSTTPLLIIEGKPMELGAIWNLPSVLSLLYLGLICSAMCYVLWNSSIRRIGVLSANVYIYAVPLVTLLAGTVFLNETVTAAGFAGMLMVIAGMFMSNRK